MAQKPHVLFILFEGLADTVIDSQVLSHVSVMQANNIATFEIWAFSCDDENYQKSLGKREKAEEIGGVVVRVFRASRPAKLGSLKKNAALLDEALENVSLPFTHIHARTEYSAAVASRIKKIQDYNLIWDCRGDAIAELDYRYKDKSIKSRLIKNLRHAVFKQRLQIAGKACDQALFVSEPLKDVMRPYIGTKPYHIIPCCGSSRLFYFDQELRQKVRDELNLQNVQTLYTYVGSLAPYQRFDDTVVHFSKIAEIDRDAILLVLTPDLEKAEKTLRVRLGSRYILKHGKFDEVNGYLNASDVAYMLRDPTPTNRVATPTKFAEYCLTGLPVIMSDAVEACFGLAAKVGNIIDEKKAAPAIKISKTQRENFADAHKKNLSREGQIYLYSETYKLQK